MSDNLKNTEKGKSPFKKLSKRELQVFELLITEHKGHEISKILGIDEKTVSTYKARILEKTKNKTIIGLYLFNLEHKLVGGIKENKNN